MKRYLIFFITASLAALPPPANSQPPTASAPAAASRSDTGWHKYAANPVLGGPNLGTCFDVALLKNNGEFRMWFSWRPKASIALAESKDGIHWSEPTIALEPNLQTGWENEVNRPIVVKRSDGYHMWYTGQTKQRSNIGYAQSPDGKNWTRVSAKPVLEPLDAWERVAVMCPHVIWDRQSRLLRMWYSGGDQFEPDAIGYATSTDGISWKRHPANPIFRADPHSAWESNKVTGCQVVPFEGWFYMFYIGFRDRDHAQIGMARSRDGIDDWQRHAGNPIISPGANEWDHDAVYKPFAIMDADRWLLWYNGRRNTVEQIGLATHDGRGLGFRLDQRRRTTSAK